MEITNHNYGVMLPENPYRIKKKIKRTQEE